MNLTGKTVLIEWQLKILNIIQRRDYFNGMQVFRCLNDLYPPYMSDMLQYTSEYNNYVYD